MTSLRSRAIFNALVGSGLLDGSTLKQVNQLTDDISCELDNLMEQVPAPVVYFPPTTEQLVDRQRADAFNDQAVRLAQELATVRTRADYLDAQITKASDLVVLPDPPEIEADDLPFLTSVSAQRGALEGARSEVGRLRRQNKELVEAADPTLVNMLYAVHKALLGAFGATRVSDIQLRQADALYVTTNMRPFMEALGGEWMDFLARVDEHTAAMKAATPRAAGEARPMIVDPKATAKEGGE